MMPPARALLLGMTVLFPACGNAKDEAPGLGAPRRYPVPGCESFDPAPCDVTTSECQARLFGLAACLRGSDPGDMPQVTLMSEADYQQYRELEYADSDPVPNLAHWESALTMLGLIQPGALEEAAEVSADVSFVYGFYDEQTKAVNVVDHGSDSSLESSSAVLLHEFVHALQDRESDLTTFRQTYFGTYDAALAADAVIEGEAQFHQERYLAAMLGFDPTAIDWDILYQNGVEVAEPAFFQEASLFTAAHRYFPYDWGARYVHLGWDATSHAGVLALFASPPADTQLEMASIHEFTSDVAGPGINAPEPSAEWTQVGADVLGAFGVFELLGRHAPVADARSSALDWRADRVVVYAGTDAGSPPATAVVWLCDFANEASADAARAMLEETLDSPASVSGTRLTVAVASDGSSLPWAFAPASP